LQVDFVEQDRGLDAGLFGRNQGAAELAFAEAGIRGHHDQQAIQVGSERLGAHLVLPVQQVAPRLDALDHALGGLFVGGLPAHLVADDAVAFLAAGLAQHRVVVAGLHQVVATVTSDHQPDAQGVLHVAAAGCRGRAARR